MAMTDDVRQAINSLTFEDAQADTNWGKQPPDFQEYLTLDKLTARGLRRASDGDKARVVDILCDYLLNGEIPNFDDFPAIVGVLSEHVITANEHAIRHVYVTKYRQHVAGVLKGRQKGE